MKVIPNRAKNILGETYGNQKCLEFTGKKSSTNNYIWLWECLNCGNVREESSGGIIHRKPKYCNSCRYKPTTKHNHSSSDGGRKTRTYSCWSKMISRAYHKYEEYNKHYGDVDVCEQWVGDCGFETFLKDMGECPSNKHSLNRVRGSKIYSPSTCEWATDKEQVYDQKRKETNKTGVTGVVWRGVPRSVWQANIRVDGLWSRYYYGTSYNECVICRVVSELLNYQFSRTLEDFLQNGINDACIRNGIDVKFWDGLIHLHGKEKHIQILSILYEKILSDSIEYKGAFWLYKKTN